MLWNDICRCPIEIQGIFSLGASAWLPEECGQSRERQQMTELRARAMSHSGPQRSPVAYLPPSRDAEEVLSGALTITPRGIVKRREVMGQCGNLYLSPLTVSLTPQKLRRISKNKASYIFITKGHRHSPSIDLNSFLIVYNKLTAIKDEIKNIILPPKFNVYFMSVCICNLPLSVNFKTKYKFRFK